MERSKTASYLGLARRAGKLVLGVTATSAVRRGVYLLVADENVGANNRKEIEKLQHKFGCPLLFIEDLEGAAGKANCKLAAVREEHLAEAILSAERAKRTDGEK